MPYLSTEQIDEIEVEMADLVDENKELRDENQELKTRLRDEVAEMESKLTEYRLKFEYAQKQIAMAT